MVDNMSCFLEELYKLIDKHDIQSLDICVNRSRNGKYIYDICNIIHSLEDNTTYIAHKPSQDELEDIFRPENCLRCQYEDTSDCRKCYDKVRGEN